MRSSMEKVLFNCMTHREASGNVSYYTGLAVSWVIVADITVPHFLFSSFALVLRVLAEHIATYLKTTFPRHPGIQM